MKTKHLLIPGTLVAVVVAIVGMVLVAHRQPGGRKWERAVTTPPPVGHPSTPPATAVAPARQPPVQIPQTNAPRLEPPQPGAAPAGNPKKTKEPVRDPVARLALSLVGADADAEAYWLTAINDPNLPANERKDLIEDLNEDGLSDPQHPGPQDLPLILRRLQLIGNQLFDHLGRFDRTSLVLTNRLI